jgi:RND family efflux transporter MFP subunit
MLMLVISGVCFALLVALMMVSGSGASQAYAQEQLLVVQNAKVTVMPIKMQSSFERKRMVYGAIESAKQSDIGFERAGILTDLSVLEGDSVNAGQVLASLDLSRLNAQQTEIEAGIARANAQARLASLSTKRVADLVKAKLEPQQRLDEAQAELDAALASLQEMQARLASLQVELDKSLLSAPFDGQIVRQYADKGTVLNNGQAVFSILAQDTLEARFGLPEDTAFGLVKGAEYELMMGETPIPAWVKSVAKQRNLATRTLDALFIIDQSKLSTQQVMALVSGNLVSINVAIEIEKNGAWVPFDALASGVRGMWTLFVYDKETQALSSRTVTVEHMNGTHAYVSGALRDNEQVVISGAHRFVPGQKVNQIEMLDEPSNAPAIR